MGVRKTSLLYRGKEAFDQAANKVDGSSPCSADHGSLNRQGARHNEVKNFLSMHRRSLSSGHHAGQRLTKRVVTGTGSISRLTGDQVWHTARDVHGAR